MNDLGVDRDAAHILINQEFASYVIPNPFRMEIPGTFANTISAVIAVLIRKEKPPDADKSDPLLPAYVDVS